MARPRIGFVGLGDMGSAIAMRIMRAGFPMTLWARRPATLEAISHNGFRVAKNLLELGASSDIVGICVFDDSDVLEVFSGEQGILAGLKPGGIVLVHSTVSPLTMGQMARLAQTRQIAVLDAPVSGSASRAMEGGLAIMVGGDAASFRIVRPVLASYGALVRRLGGVGAGQTMKLLNNTLAAANLALSSVALEAAKALELDADAAVDVLKASSGSSFMLNLFADQVSKNPEYAARVGAIIAKDVALYRQHCSSIEEGGASLIDEAALHALKALDLLIGNN